MSATGRVVAQVPESYCLGSKASPDNLPWATPKDREKYRNVAYGKVLMYTGIWILISQARAPLAHTDS